MKKYFILLCMLLSLTGCGEYNLEDAINEFSKSVENSKSYKTNGTMEISSGEEIFTYSIDTYFLKDDYYKVVLVNQTNNHEQIILKNDDGVYILTPSLNKSFKFQSDWPYNNSQIYLLQSIISDLDNDEKRTFKNEDKSYVFTSSVNYPNNRNLVKQKVTFNDKLELNEVIVLDSDDIPNMTLKVKDIDFSPSFKKNYFDFF